MQNKIQEEFVKKGVEFYKKNKIGYLDVAMRVGKCKIALNMVDKIYEGDHSLLIAYPDNKLLDTWADEMRKWDYDNPDVTFVNFSSVHKYVDNSYDFVVIDEFHSTSPLERADCLKIIGKGKGLLLSGTISDDTKKDWRVKEIGKYTTEEGIRDQILADYTITVHLVNLDRKVLIKAKNGKYRTEKQRYDAYTWVMNKFRYEGKPTMMLALARNRLSLSSLGKKNYVKQLLQTLKDQRVLVFTGLAKVADDLGIPSYHSKSSDNSFKDFQDKKVNHLALAGMGKLGVSYKDLDSVILLNFTYNAEETSQILNRAIKLDYHGKVADLNIICLNEDVELKKIKESLSMLDKNKIKYATN